MLTYDVQIWGIRRRANRAAAYQLRWRVGPRPFSKSYKIKAQADGRRTELLTALRNREQFCTDTGLPASEVLAAQSVTWYTHAREYAGMKWPASSAKHRAGIADALATVTPHLVKDRRGAPALRVLRTALYSWVFRFVVNEAGERVPRIDAEEAPDDIVAALDWISRKSVDITALNTPAVLRSALDALALKLDGKIAADNTVNRKVPVFSNCLRYAVERERLASLPLEKVDWTPPETDDEIDFRFVPGPGLARKLIDAVGDQGVRGRHLKAFFGCLYYAANRPGETASLREGDFTLPEEGWGEVVLSASSPRVGSGWTDSGESYDSRGLKKRARKATRTVPIPPVLVRLVREHLEEFGTADDGQLFRAVRGGGLLSKEYGDIWKHARRGVLSKEDAASPLAEVPYSLRHAGVSLWLESGVSPAEVARRAGHSITVLFRFYAKAIHRSQHRANQQIERALEGSEESQDD